MKWGKKFGNQRATSRRDKNSSRTIKCKKKQLQELNNKISNIYIRVLSNYTEWYNKMAGNTLNDSILQYYDQNNDKINSNKYMWNYYMIMPDYIIHCHETIQKNVNNYSYGIYFLNDSINRGYVYYSGYIGRIFYRGDCRYNNKSLGIVDVNKGPYIYLFRPVFSVDE